MKPITFTFSVIAELLTPCIRKVGVLCNAIKMSVFLALVPVVVSGQVQTVKIYAIGDSITRGSTHDFDAADYPLSAYRLNSGGAPGNLRSYREHLHDLLSNSSGCNASIEWVGSKEEPGRVPEFHEGRAGWRADEINTREWSDDSGINTRFGIDDWLVEFAPNYVLIHLGTNDNQFGESAQTTLVDLATLLDNIALNAPDATVLLANVIPVYGWWAIHINRPPYPADDRAGELAELSLLIGQLVAQRQAAGDDVHLVDVSSGFYVDTTNVTNCITGDPGDPLNMSTSVCKALPDGSGEEPDGIHTNIVGDKFIADQFFEVINSSTSLCAVSQTDTLEIDSPVLTDDISPIVEIISPSYPNQLFLSKATFEGRATDAGGSGFDLVEISVLDATGDYLNFDSGLFDGVQRWGEAVLSNTAVDTTQWSISTPGIPIGTYVVQVIASDLAGNRSITVSRSFAIDENIDEVEGDTDLKNSAISSSRIASGCSI